MPTSQTAADRPISFVLHDKPGNKQPVVFPLVIRPEDLTRTDSSRLNVHQTLGGAWADNFGPGVPSVTIAGHTGWGAKGRPDGWQEFQDLYDKVFVQYHKARELAVLSGKDPDDVQLIFCDVLDDFTWIVAPQGFVLKRNRARPLLSQYQISMVKLADSTYKKRKAGSGADDAPSMLEAMGLGSLAGSIATIANFSTSIAGAIQAALGPIATAVQDFVKLTSGVLNTVKGLITVGKNALNVIAGPLLSLAQDMSQAAHNVMCIVSAIKSIPSIVKAKFMQVTGAFRNVFCVLKNVFKGRTPYPDYSSVYGASTCSSTNGGSPPSPYAGDNDNLFRDMFSRQKQPVSVNSTSANAIGQLARMDVSNPPSMTSLASTMSTATAGVNLAGVA